MSLGVLWFYLLHLATLGGGGKIIKLVLCPHPSQILMWLPTCLPTFRILSRLPRFSQKLRSEGGIGVGAVQCGVL